MDADRIVLLGWALGGGVAIAEAADDRRVRGVAVGNAIGAGRRSTRLMHDDESWERLLGRIAEDRRRRAVTGRSQLVPPFEIIRLDTATRGDVDAELYKAAGLRSDVTLEAAELLLRFRPERFVDQIAPRPLLLLRGERNDLHTPAESRSLYERALEPKEQVMLEGRGHIEWMYDDDATFREVCDRLRMFLSEALDRPGADAIRA